MEKGQVERAKWRTGAERIIHRFHRLQMSRTNQEPARRLEPQMNTDEQADGPARRHPQTTQITQMSRTNQEPARRVEPLMNTDEQADDTKCHPESAEGSRRRTM